MAGKSVSSLGSDFYQVKALFTAWRNSKKNLRAKIPEKLYLKTYSLVEKYTPSLLCKQLGLAYSRFMEKYTQWQKDEVEEKFVQVKAPAEHTSNYKLKFTNNTEKSVSITVENIDTKQIINLIREYLN